MSTPSHKTCTKCGEEKSLEEFYSDKRVHDGRRADCKKCHRETKRIYYRGNRDRIIENSRLSYEKNRVQVLERKSRWREKNRDKVLKQKRQYREENLFEELERVRRWREENREYARLLNREYSTSYQSTSIALAKRRAAPYSPSEDVFLLEDNGMTLYQKSVSLGRTYAACKGRLQKLRKESNAIST